MGNFKISFFITHSSRLRVRLLDYLLWIEIFAVLFILNKDFVNGFFNMGFLNSLNFRVISNN